METAEFTTTISGGSAAAILDDAYHVVVSAEEYQPGIDTTCVSIGVGEVMVEVLDDFPAIDCDLHLLAVEVEKMD